MNDKEDYVVIGEKLRQRRALCGLSQSQIAQLADLNKNHYSDIERGLYSLKLHTAVNIAAALDMSLDSLLNEIYGSASEQFISALIGEIRKLPPDHRRFIFKMVEIIKEFRIEKR